MKNVITGHLKKAIIAMEHKADSLNKNSCFWTYLFLIYGGAAILMYWLLATLTLAVCFQAEKESGISLTHTLHLYNMWAAISMFTIYLFLFYILLYIITELRKELKNRESVL